MRKIALVLVVALAFSTTATAVDIAISTQAGWFGQGAADREMQEIVASVTTVTVDVFTASDQVALANWVKDHTGDGASDLLILCGQFPNTIYAPGNTQANDSLAERFLDDGNCIINTGDYIFYVVDGAGTNAEPGLETMMDIAHISMWDDDTAVVVTAEGKKYTPTLKDFATDRPWHLDELQGDWKPELILAQNAAGTRADPAIIVNTATGGRLGTFYQTAGQDNDPRGKVISEWINNWYLPNLGGANPLPRRPNPKDGSMIDKTWVQAAWKAGDFAALHDVYFGESAEQVDAATRDDATVYVGRQAVTQLIMGMAGGPAPAGLVPGKTYYWRVDEINDADPNSPWKGKVWSFTIRPQTAWAPFPIDGMQRVDPNQDLSWDFGMGVIFHQIYFGESFDQVNSIPAGGWMSVAAAYDPGPLQLDKTYYWRVDEFTGPVTHKGPVWSFTTRGPGGGVKAQYFAGMELAGDPILAQTEPSINHNWGSGDVTPGVADLVSARWTANLEVPVTESYQLITSTDDGVRLWLDGHQVIDGWVDQGTTDYVANVNLVAGQVYHIRMEYYENGGGAVAQLSWKSATLGRQIIPQGWLTLPLHATGPSPAHADPHAVQDGVLRWIAGEEATNHDVYFGEDANAVANADTTTAGIYKGRQAADETSFDAGALDWNKTYYWRVDEINEANPASPWKGSLWSFTTADFLIVEDFESYTDDMDGGAAIFQTWIDGAENNTGSYVGYETASHGTFGETQVVYSGFQAMPLDYNNVNSPYYSEADRTWETAQNWTENDVAVLTLYVRGRSANDPAPLYVALEDSAGHAAVVGYGDDAVVKSGAWVEWKIPLSQFGGVNLNRIKKMSIGVGNRDNPAPDGAGLIYIDDIRVTKAAGAP